MVIGGTLSVVFYRRRIPVANVTPWMGARLGMVSGILGAGIFAALLSIGAVCSTPGMPSAEKLMEGMSSKLRPAIPTRRHNKSWNFSRSPEGIVVLLTTA